MSTEKMFLDFLMTKDITEVPSDKAQLNTLLKEMWPSLRTVKGDQYRASSLQTIRQLLRIFVQKAVSVDIIADPDMTHNIVFDNYLKSLKKVGKGCVSHFKEVKKEDLTKIVNALDDQDPQQLQWLTWFYIQLHLCRRGTENLFVMQKGDLEVKKCGETTIIQLTKNYQTKNHTETNEDAESGGRIASVPGNQKCPVKIIVTYLEKLNTNIQSLWQRPKKKFSLSSAPWYDAVPVGHNTLSSMMKTISIHCGLETTYTNHCLRVSACTLLGEAGYTDLDIQAVSQHKSLSALAIYKRVKTTRKVEMYKSLSQAMGVMPNHQSSSASVICSGEVNQPSSSASVICSGEVNQPSSSTSLICSGEVLLIKPPEEENTNTVIDTTSQPTCSGDIGPLVEEVESPTLQELDLTDAEWTDMMAFLNTSDHSMTHQHNGCCLSYGSSNIEIPQPNLNIQQNNQAAIKKGNKVVILNNCTIGTFNF
jgi:hypothetical protein